MSQAVVGLVVALPEECRSLTARRVRRGDCLPLDEARIASVSGVGSENAARAARHLVDAGARGLVSWGCAAGLSPDLRPGTLCLPREIVDLHARRWAASHRWHELTREGLRVEGSAGTGILLTADRLATTVAQKAAWAAKWGAIAVDMESAAVAAVAHELDVPFLCVRAIADPADTALPRAVVHAIDATGSIDRSALLGELLLHPGELGALLRLASQFRAALRTLAGAADRMGAALRLDPRGA